MNRQINITSVTVSDTAFTARHSQPGHGRHCRRIPTRRGRRALGCLRTTASFASFKVAPIRTLLGTRGRICRRLGKMEWADPGVEAPNTHDGPGALNGGDLVYRVGAGSWRRVLRFGGWFPGASAEEDPATCMRKEPACHLSPVAKKANKFDPIE